MEHYENNNDTQTIESQIALGATMFSTVGCVGDVRPGPDGIHSVMLLADDRDDGARMALRRAKRWCKMDKQDFVVPEEMVSFICDMDEADYIETRQLAAAAQAAGAVLLQFCR